jgi:hypothetical protein
LPGILSRNIARFKRIDLLQQPPGAGVERPGA